jgi:hypothetical protein
VQVAHLHLRKAAHRQRLHSQVLQLFLQTVVAVLGPKTLVNLTEVLAGAVVGGLTPALARLGLAQTLTVAEMVLVAADSTAAAVAAARQILAQMGLAVPAVPAVLVLL